jgi:hypothetical protein
MKKRLSAITPVCSAPFGAVCLQRQERKLLCAYDAAPGASSAPAVASDSAYAARAMNTPTTTCPWKARARKRKWRQRSADVITRNDALSDKMIYSASARVETIEL